MCDHHIFFFRIYKYLFFFAAKKAHELKMEKKKADKLLFQVLYFCALDITHNAFILVRMLVYNIYCNNWKKIFCEF